MPSNLKHVEASERLVREARETLREYEELMLELRDYEKRRSEIYRMFSTGQVSKEVYEALMNDLRQSMLPLVERYFRMRVKLQQLASQLRMAVTKLQVEAKTIESPFQLTYDRRQLVRYTLDRAGRVLEEVEHYLRSVSVERELRLIEILLDSLDYGTGAGIVEEWRSAIENVLTRWSEARLSYAAKVDELRRKIEALQESLRELEIRFMVGEYDRSEYEVRRTRLEREVAELTAQLESLQNKLEDMDFIAARCKEVLVRLR